MQKIKYLPILFFAMMAISANTPRFGATYTEDELLQEFRQKLKLAAEDEKICNDLYAKAGTIQHPKPLLKGYIGAVTIARSKHVSLFDKLSTFKKGAAILEEAVTAAPNETELRLLRLTLQHNLPGFLGYKDHIADDKEFILANFSNTPPALQGKIADYVNTSGRFTDQEKQRLRV
ncbi:MAG: hypothetical protein R2830_00105 [Saprospiraceae bacterium]